MKEVATKHLLGLKKEIDIKRSRLLGSKLREQKDEELKKIIANASANVADRLLSADDESKGNMDSALNLFTQALVLADTNIRQARRLFNIGKRLSRKKS